MLASRRTDQPIAAVIIYSMEGLIEIASRGVDDRWPIENLHSSGTAHTNQLAARH
jgi:hypothetical protein